MKWQTRLQKSNIEALPSSFLNGFPNTHGLRIETILKGDSELLLNRINELRQQYQRYSEILKSLRQAEDPQMIGELKYSNLNGTGIIT